MKPGDINRNQPKRPVMNDIGPPRPAKNQDLRLETPTLAAVPQTAPDFSLQDVSVSKPPSSLKPKKRWLKRLVIAVLTLIVALGATGVTGFRWYQQQLKPLTAEDVYHVISVGEGSSVASIARGLAQKKIIRSAQAFEWYVKLNKVPNLQAGSYQLSSRQSVAEITTILKEGKVTSVDILIPPGQRLDQITEALAKAGYEKTEIEAAYSAIRDHQLLANLPADKPLEGYIFPETYKIGAATTAEELLRLALDTFEARITSELQAGLAQQNLTLEQAIILASIVQTEEADLEAQRTVAQVFIKRLKEGIPLGADPTALYGARKDGVELPKDDPGQAAAIAVVHDSSYNTRLHAGLPPSAIANFNASALAAVANPTETDYLFFVAGSDGVTRFSRTQAEHDALTRQYCPECLQ